jgi:GNAT superfamily N-acetyltransferase
MEVTQVITAPQPITADHDVSEFESKSEALNDWLKNKSFKNEGDTARTYVVTCDHKVIAYYCLATSAVNHITATRKARQNAPDPVPCMLIGKLAVDKLWEGKGIGSGLLRDAIHRILRVSEIVGTRCVLVHTKDEDAKNFYLKHKFQQSPIEPLTLMMTLKDIRKNLE